MFDSGASFASRFDRSCAREISRPHPNSVYLRPRGMGTELDAVVVGSGPNGMAAAITMARAGLSVRMVEANSTIGGGVRSAELTLPGFLHDVCSAIHPLGAGSPFFRSLPLAELGFSWIEPDIPLAHPFDDGTAACLHRDLQRTSDLLGKDGKWYRRLLEPSVRNWEILAEEFLQPVLHFPRHPLVLARFGLPALLPASVLTKAVFTEAKTRALIGGIAAHSFLPLEAPISSAFALVLGAAAHAVSWPIPRGGSQALTDTLADYFRQLGGTVQTDCRMDRLEDLPKARASLFDLSAWQFARLAEDRLPLRYRRRLQNFRHAPAVFKIDYALSSPIPWRADGCRHAGTVHVCGGWNELAATEREAVQGRLSERPFVLVGQQSLFDETRAPTGQHTLWAYAHVPAGCDVDVSPRIESQIERFAPGFRDCILARHTSGPAQLERSNANLVRGDINGGAANLKQLLARPVLGATPYRTPIPGFYLCSSSTPPGGGVHGMCGYHAARTALRDLLGLPAR